MHSPLINVMSAAVVKAGKGLLRDFGEVDQLQISRKGTADFVTSTDLRTEKLLQQELKRARPDFGFLLEEGGEIAGKDPEHRWVIDPLDGTINFIHAVPYFCVSVALERRSKNGGGEIIAGATFNPIANELFTAEKGKGAFLNNRRLAVSVRSTVEEAILATGNLRSLIANVDGAFLLLNQLAKSGITLRYLGATALDLAYLAAGRVDACWYPTVKPWDIAAGMLFVQEAGGVVSDLSGGPIAPQAPTLFASNQALSLPVRKLLAKAA